MRKLVAIGVLVLFTWSSELSAVSANKLATREGEIIFGQAWLKLVRGRLGERVDPFCIDLLETLIMRLQNQYSLGSMPMTAMCLNGQDFNAFAAPGGIVGVNSGVYIDLDSESEIMAVLAHELAHLEQRHHYRSLRNSQGMSAVKLATLIGIVTALASRDGQLAQSFLIGGQAANASSVLAYSRSYEREADRIGMKALHNSGYPAHEMSDILQILAEKQTQSSRDLVFLSTHPTGIERQSDLDSRLSKMPLTQNRAPILSKNDFHVFRCLQTEGYDGPLRNAETKSCSAIHGILKLHRAEDYQLAINAFDQLPKRWTQTFSGLDLEIALSSQSGHYARAKKAIETIHLFFPSWLQPVIAMVDLRIAQGQNELPRELRKHMIRRPERLDLWRALARFATSFKQEHLLFEARGWDAFLHGKMEAAKTQLKQARNSWPENLDSRPLDLLNEAIITTETL